MATKVQAKPYFPGFMMDLNNGWWDLYHDDRTSGSEKSQFYDSFTMTRTMETRQIILKQESMFRHQLQELHRLYRRQRDLMNELAMKKHYECFSSKCSTTQRRVFDLELPADVDQDNVNNLSSGRAFNLTELNEPVPVEKASFTAYLCNKQQKKDLSSNSNSGLENSSRKRRVFGVELCERSHVPSFDSLSSSSYNHWLGSTDESRQIPESFAGNSRLMTSSRAGVPYQMNMDSLQNHSQQFFKKAEMTKTDNSQGITKILGVPIIYVPKNSKDLVKYSHDPSAETKGFDKENGRRNLRHHIDLNLSFEELEEVRVLPSTPYIPEAIVKIATMEVDLEASAVLESETDGLTEDHEELVKVAAEAIMSISSSELLADDTMLRWFAEVIASGDVFKKDSANSDKDEEFISEGMDYLEYMTLKLQETKEEYYCYKPMISDEMEEEDGNLQKRTTKKGHGKRGRQRKDFQRDVLPGIVSLSRREASEDLETFEEAFAGIGVSWPSSFSKRKAAGKNGRGRPRLVALSPSSQSPPPEAADQTVCREEKCLISGWGKRIRRLPRQRCQNGGNHQSLAFKR